MNIKSLKERVSKLRSDLLDANLERDKAVQKYTARNHNQERTLEELQRTKLDLNERRKEVERLAKSLDDSVAEKEMLREDMTLMKEELLQRKALNEYATRARGIDIHSLEEKVSQLNLDLSNAILQRDKAMEQFNGEKRVQETMMGNLERTKLDLLNATFQRD